MSNSELGPGGGPFPFPGRTLCLEWVGSLCYGQIRDSRIWQAVTVQPGGTREFFLHHHEGIWFAGVEDVAQGAGEAVRYSARFSASGPAIQWLAAAQQMEFCTSIRSCIRQEVAA